MQKVIKSKPLPQRLKKVKEAIESAGQTIGSVHFCKRSDDSLRKMSFRLHARNPSVASKPRGGKSKDTDKDNLQMTVLDVNKPVKKEGEIVGRGAWRTIPLEGVKRIKARGVEYIVA